MKLKNILPLLIVILCALFWTFINYQNRWTLSQDQARDAIIGIYSLKQGILPIVGPPSSLGFFSFGPFYYWLIIFFTALLPGISNAPWIGFSLFSIFEVILFYFLGNSLGGKKFGFILGIMASFSSARVFHSVDLLNPILVPFFITLSLFALTKFLQTKKTIWAFLLSLSIGLAINFHFQALGLLTILFLLFIPYFKTEANKKLVWLFLGLLIPFLPLIFFYSQASLPHGLTSSSIFTLSSIPKQFLKDVLFTWPNLSGETLFFIPKLGYPVTLAVTLLFIFTFKKLSKAMQIIFVSLVLQAILLSLYPGDRTSVYLLVFHPFVILLTGWALFTIFQKPKLAGFSLFVVFILISTYSNLSIIKGYTQRPLISEIKQTIDNQTNGKNENKISLYEVGNSDMVSLPLFYLYLRENRISDEGFKLGSCAYSCSNKEVPFLVKGNYSFYNLSDANPLQTNQSGFKKITPQNVYKYLSNYYTH